MDIPIDFVIRSGDSDTASQLRDYAARRLSFALRRFEDRVRSVTVRLTDTNGPKGGVDSRCAITLHRLDGRRIVTEATTAWPFASVTSAAKRLKAAVRREIERTRVSARRGGKRSRPDSRAPA
jgi:putative sigma-54 modulation protein